MANRDGLADYRTRLDDAGPELRGLGAVESNLERAAEIQWGTERLDKPRERPWPQVSARPPVHLPALDRTRPIGRVLRALTEARRPF